MFRVLLADDHSVVREGYRRLLERFSDFKVVAEAGSGDEAYHSFCQHQPDLVVMDINLPGMSGLEATRRILAREPNAKVLVFSMYADHMVVSRALQAGARGYVSKGSAPEELLGAARRVCSGGVYLSEDIARELALQAVPGGHAVDALSPREFEVFRLLAAGHSIADIARSLSLSHKTIANYQSAIKQKLEADTSAQMVWIALRRGIVGAPDTSSD